MRKENIPMAVSKETLEVLRSVCTSDVTDALDDTMK